MKAGEVDRVKLKVKALAQKVDEQGKQIGKLMKGQTVKSKENYANRKFACNTCELKCIDNKDKHKHEDRMHRLLEIPLQCIKPWCNQRMETKCEFKVHMASCLYFSSELNCPSAGKGIKKPQSWREHLARHRKQEDLMLRALGAAELMVQDNF